MGRPRIADRIAANPGYVPQPPIGGGRRAPNARRDAVQEPAPGTGLHPDLNAGDTADVHPLRPADAGGRSPWAAEGNGQAAPKLGLLLAGNAAGGPRLQRHRHPAPDSAPVLDPSVLEAQESRAPASVAVRRVCARPGTLLLRTAPVAWGEAMVGRCLGIALLDESHLEALTTQQLQDALADLAQSQHWTHWHFGLRDSLPRGRWMPFWPARRISGTSVLVLSLMARQQPQMAERILALRPVEIANDLAHVLPELFGLRTLECIFRDMIPLVTTQRGAPKIAQDEQIGAMGAMVAAFLSTHAQARKDHIEAWTVALMQRLENSGFSPTSPNLGLLAGVIFAGCLRYSADINRHDRRRREFITNVSMVCFAASNFIGSTRWVAALAVTSVVVGIGLGRFWPVRDYDVFCNTLHGKLNARLSNLDMFKSPYDRDQMMDWISIARQCNGF